MSKIEWTDHTWNPISGCTPCSQGCENCYAEMISRRLKGRYGYHHQNPFQITLHKDKFKELRRLIKPRKIFVCSMGDLFHPNVPDQWIDAVFQTTSLSSQHAYQILTKRPVRMQQYISSIVNNHQIQIPDNYWFGVTAENQYMADLRIPILIDTPVPNRFVSIEPMLQPVDIRKYINHLDWVIVGGETGVKARYLNPDWARDVRDLCR